jgi:hypothetical protein
VDWNGLAGVESDTHRERQFRLTERLFDEPLLEVDGRTDRLTRRREDAKRLVPTELQEGAATSLHTATCDVAEQERPDLDVVRSIVPARVVGLVRAGHAEDYPPGRRRGGTERG